MALMIVITSDNAFNFSLLSVGLTTEGIQHCFWRGMWQCQYFNFFILGGFDKKI